VTHFVGGTTADTLRDGGQLWYLFDAVDETFVGCSALKQMLVTVLSH
jgi:hypothetical protein